jgi:hypothetical protein
MWRRVPKMTEERQDLEELLKEARDRSPNLEEQLQKYRERKRAYDDAFHVARRKAGGTERASRRYRSD